jgi:Phage integrase family
MAWGRAWADCGLVFTREDGAPLRPGHISEHLAVLVRKAGLPPIRFHDLRHGSATLSLAAGVDIKIVQEMLGRSTSAFTRNVYTSVVPEIAAAAAEAVAAIVPRRANSVPTGGLNDHENGIQGHSFGPLCGGVCTGSGGGRESNPPAPQRSAHRF